VIELLGGRFCGGFGLNGLAECFGGACGLGRGNFSGGTSLSYGLRTLTLSGTGCGLSLFNAALLLSKLSGTRVDALLSFRTLRIDCGGLGELVRKPLNLSSRVNDTLLTGVEGMTNTAKVDTKVLAR
jgi:hypothetical protein